MKLWISLSAIPLSEYKKWGGHGLFNRDMYEDLFFKQTKMKNAWRIYLPVNSKALPAKKVTVPAVVDKEVVDKGYRVEDYVAGIAVDPTGKRRIKIGKLLTPAAKKVFDNDSQRKASRLINAPLLVVISRHPYDLMGMSTNRGWTSCTNMKDGSNRKYVKQDVKFGTLIAYLVKTDDKNINNPIGRVRIYRYTDEANPKNYLLVRDSTVYGTNAPGFLETIDNWLSGVNDDRVEGTYCISPGVLSEEPTAGSTFYIIPSLESFNKTAYAKKVFNPDTTNTLPSVKFGPNFQFDEAIEQGNLNLLFFIASSPSTPSDVLSKVFDQVMSLKSGPTKGNSKEIAEDRSTATKYRLLSVLAGNPNTTEKILTKIVETGIAKVVAAVAYSHNMTKKLADLIMDRVPEVIPRLTSSNNLSKDYWASKFNFLDGLKNSQLKHQVFMALFENVQLPTKIELKVLDSPRKYDSYIRSTIAQHSQNEAVLRRACLDKDQDVVESALGNSKFPSDMYAVMLPKVKPPVVELMLQNSNVPNDVLHSIVNGKYSVELKVQAMLHNQFVWTVSDLERALKNENRKALYGSRILDNLTDEQFVGLVKKGFLRTLIDDYYIDIKAQQVDLVYDDLSDADKILVAGNIQQPSPSVSKKIISEPNVDIRAAFAKYTEDNESLVHLLKDPVQEVRVAAARNPNLDLKELKSIVAKFAKTKPVSVEDKDFLNVVERELKNREKSLAKNRKLKAKKVAK